MYLLMHKNYTPETLLQYVYKELPASEMAEIRRVLQIDSILAFEFNELCQSINMLTEVSMQPSDSSIEIIMEHSLETHETTF